MRRAPLVALALALLGTVVLGSANAQEAPQGRITGELVAGTEGADLDRTELVAEFIMLAGAEVIGTVPVTVEEDGTFSLEVPLDAERRYFPYVVYRGVSYLTEFTEPVTVSEEQPEVVVRLPPLYETTSAVPNLSIGETVVTVVALDRGAGELGLIRKDIVLNPADVVYVGGENGVTLRLPVPERTINALGESLNGAFALEDGILTTTVPIRAEGDTSIVTRYLVTYDVAEDEYVLRVTTPVAANRIVVRIPEDYVRDIEILGEGTEGETEFFEVADGDPLRTIVMDNAGLGDSLVVRLEGLALERNSNPLAETPGSLIAGAIALVLIGTAGAVAIARGRGAEA